MSAGGDRTAARRARERAAWDQLNDRQRAYLRAVYAEDQAAEAEVADLRRRWVPVPPAAEWRTLLVAVDSPLAADTAIQRRLHAAGVHDQGAGSTLAALERRGLITISRDLTFVGMPVERVWARLTRAGRAAARAGLGVSAPARPPKGLLKSWLWWRLVAIASAGDAGADDDALGKGGEWWVYLGERGRGYVKQRPDQPGGRGRWAWYLTEAGAAHISAHRAAYARLYPDIDTTGLPETA